MANTASTAWYRQGTVSVADGSTEVTGNGTRFLLAGINQGATFRIDGKSGVWEVKSVVSDTKIELAKSYDGGTVSNAGYSIDRNFQSTLPADLSARLAMAIGEWELRYDTDMMTITGKSAYEVAKENGYTGTVSQWLESLKGKSAYALAIENGYTGTEAEWLESLKAAGEIIKINARLDPISVNNAYAHNSVYRGKNLGSDITAEMSSAIRAGTFENIYPGDYFEAKIPAYTWTDWEGNIHEEPESQNALIWDVLGCNGFYHDSPHVRFRTNHIAVAPRYGLYPAQMNETDTTEGGYVGSDMFTKHLKRAEAIVKAVFGDEHVLPHPDTLCNTVTDGVETGWVHLEDRIVDLMSEYMCFGRIFRWNASLGSYDHAAIAHSQFPLFWYRPDLAGFYGSLGWLREAVDRESFATLTTWGSAQAHRASDPENWGNVKPFFLLY